MKDNNLGETKNDQQQEPGLKGEGSLCYCRYCGPEGGKRLAIQWTGGLELQEVSCTGQRARFIALYGQPETFTWIPRQALITLENEK